jgi:DNA-binding NarL/FixJ family response regulator
LIVLDIGLPKLNGIEAALSIRKAAPESKILFASENRSSEITAAALTAGGRGYVVKSDGANELLVAVEAVLQDRRFVSSTFRSFDFTTIEGQSSGEFR